MASYRFAYLFFMVSGLDLIHRGEVTQIYASNLDNH